MGQLVYLPRDQKYRIGPSAVAMSTSMMKGLQLRNLIRLRLQDVAEHLPGTVGFVIPDRFHLVYLEFARAANALGLHESTGSRISMASTAAGSAYLSALDPEVGDALINEMERETPDGAKLARSRIEANRIHDCGGTTNNQRHAIYVEHAEDTRIVGNVIYDNADRGVQRYPSAQRTLGGGPETPKAAQGMVDSKTMRG